MRGSIALQYDAKADRHVSDEWIVEAIDEEGEGRVYMARFTGPKARERAEEYAEWKNSGGGATY